MKKKFLLIMFAFALFGIAQAQSNLHWPAISNIPLNWDPSNMSAFMTINIDGTELANGCVYGRHPDVGRRTAIRD